MSKANSKPETRNPEQPAHGMPNDARFVPIDVLIARAEYLKDWRERMATFRHLQREYMPKGRGLAGERMG